MRYTRLPRTAISLRRQRSVQASMSSSSTTAGAGAGARMRSSWPWRRFLRCRGRSLRQWSARTRPPTTGEHAQFAAQCHWPDRLPRGRVLIRGRMWRRGYSAEAVACHECRCTAAGSASGPNTYRRHLGICCVTAPLGRRFRSAVDSPAPRPGAPWRGSCRSRGRREALFHLSATPRGRRRGGDRPSPRRLRPGSPPGVHCAT